MGAAAGLANIIDNNQWINDAAAVENVNEAPVENVGNQVNNNDNHEVADDLFIDAPAPVGNVADIAENNEQLIDGAAVENVGNQDNNNDNHDVADAPVGNVADIAYNNERLIDAAAVEIVGNQANNDDNHDVADNLLFDASAPVGNVADHHESDQ